MSHCHWRGRVTPLPLEREASSVPLEIDGGPLPFHKKCGPLQLDGEGVIVIGGRGAHCHWIGKMPFARDMIMI